MNGVFPAGSFADDGTLVEDGTSLEHTVAIINHFFYIVVHNAIYSINTVNVSHCQGLAVDGLTV